MHPISLFHGLVLGFPLSKFLLFINSLWPTGAIWRQRSWSTLARVMACCLTNVDWSSVKSSDLHIKAISLDMSQPSITEICLKIACLKLYSNFPGANEVNWICHSVIFCRHCTIKFLITCDEKGYINSNLTNMQAHNDNTHNNDVKMSAMASQITSLTIVYSTVYSRRRSKKTSKLRVTGLCVGNLPVTGEFPAQRASNAENVSIWWRHHKLWCFGRWL